MKIAPRAYVLASLAMLVWVGIGVMQKTAQGREFGEALASEFPLALVVFGVALAIAAQRNRGR